MSEKLKRRNILDADLDTEICALETCLCSLKAGDGIMAGGEFYCCGECASGEGCAHEDCNCGEGVT